MDRAVQISQLFLAYSPWTYLVLTVSVFWFFDSSAGAAVGCVPIYVPMVVLLFTRPALSPRARAILVAATSTGLLFVPAAMLCASPLFLLEPDTTSSAGIVLKPWRGKAESVDISGLSVRFDPRLEKAKQGPPYQFQLSVRRRGGVDGSGPPRRFEDGYGNRLEFTQPGPMVVQLVDGRGGYARIRWDGEQFILDDFRAAGKSESARGPTSLAVQLGNWGGGLLVVTPLLCWLLLALFARQLRADQSESTRRSEISAVLQGLGIAFALCIPFSPAGPGHEIGPIGSICCWWAFSGAGLYLLTAEILREEITPSLRRRRAQGSEK
jgi:hypothetical protein